MKPILNQEQADREPWVDGPGAADIAHQRHPKKPIYHYTTQEKLASFLQGEVINLAERSCVGEERAVVWLSEDPVWEGTANMAIDDGQGNIRLGNRESTDFMYGLARIEIKRGPEIVRWKHFKRNGWFSEKRVRQLERLGVVAGADPYLWHVSTNAIPVEKWNCVEVFEKGKWQKVDGWKSMVGNGFPELLESSEPRLKFVIVTPTGQIECHNFLLSDEALTVLQKEGVSVEEFRSMALEMPGGIELLLRSAGRRGGVMSGTMV